MINSLREVIGAALFSLVPMSGIVALRTLGREIEPLRVAANGATLGLAAYWLLLRLLAPNMPFKTAAWLAYAVVVAAGLATWLRRRKASVWLHEDSHKITLMLVMFACVFGVSAYAAAEVLFTFDETMTHHLPLVASIQRGNFPPIDLREPPHVLEYHWGQHLLAAGVSEITGTSVWVALFSSNALLAALVFLTAYLLARRETSPLPAALGAVLLVAGGTLNWLSAPQHTSPTYSFGALMDPFKHTFTSGNLIVGGFFWHLHTNSTTWPVCLLLVSIDLLWHGVREKLPALILVATLALAMVGPGSETIFCAAIAGLLGTIALARTRTDIVSWSQSSLLFAAVLVAVAVTIILGGPLASFVSTGSASHQAHVTLNVQHFGQVPSWNFGNWFSDPPWIPILSWRFLQDVGPVPFLLIPALIWALKRRSLRLTTLAVVAISSLTAATVLTLTKYPANMYRLVSHAAILGALPVGAFIVTLCEPRRVTRILALLLLGILIAAWPLSHFGHYQSLANQLPWPTPTAARKSIDEEAITWLRAHTLFSDALLPLPLNRWEVLASGQVHPLGSYVGGRAEYNVRAQLAAERLDATSLANAKIKYIYANRNFLTETSLARLDAAVAAGIITARWQSTTDSRVIYQVR